MKRGVIVFALLAVAVASCGNRTALRNRAVVTAVGLHGTAGAYTVAVQAVEPLKIASGLAEQSEAATAVYEASGASVAAALESFLSEAGRETYILQNRMVLVSDALCRTASVFDTVSYLFENGDVRVPVAVCRGNPAAMLQNTGNTEAVPADYLLGILKEGAANGTCVLYTVLDLQRAASGMYDAVLPVFKAGADNRPRPDGTLLLRNGMVAGELDAVRTMGLAVLTGRVERVMTVVDGVTYAVTNPKVTITASPDGVRFAYAIDVRGEATAVESRAGAEPRVQTVADYLKTVMEQTLAALDAADCDPLALARRAAQEHPNTTQKTARSHLSECDKAVSVTLKWSGQSGEMQRLSAKE